MEEQQLFRVGVLTISDRVSKGLAEDKSGPAIKEIILDGLKNSKVSELENRLKLYQWTSIT